MLHARKVYINHMGTYLLDPREQALRDAMYRSIGEPNPFEVWAREHTS